MLKMTIKGVLSNGEVLDRVLEGDLVSAFAIENKENSVLMDGCTAGNSDIKSVTKAIILNLFRAIENDKNEQELLKMAVEQIKSRLDELAEKPGSEDAGRLDVKVAVVSGSDVAKFLKGLLGGR